MARKTFRTIAIDSGLSPTRFSKKTWANILEALQAASRQSYLQGYRDAALHTKEEFTRGGR